MLAVCLRCQKRAKEYDVSLDVFEELLTGEAGTMGLFVDEFADSSDGMKGASHGILTDGEIGAYRIAERTAIVLASNPPDCSTSGGRMSPGLVSRVCTIAMTPGSQRLECHQ